MTQDEDPEEGAPGFVLGDLLSHVQEMQDKLAAAQAEAADMLVEGKAAGGAVIVHVTGGLDFRAIKIDPKFLAENDVTMVEDTILAAIQGAMGAVSELNRSAIEQSGLGGLDDLGSLGDLDSMFGMLTGGAGGGDLPAADHEAGTEDDAGSGA